jgi:hypothetical protein
MDRDRISKWKCPDCGSRHKKNIDIIGSNKKKIGFALFCCDCGHIQHFAWTIGAAKAFCGMNNGAVSNCEVSCGVDADEIKHCKDRNCVYRPHPAPKGPKISVRQEVVKKEQDEYKLPPVTEAPITPDKVLHRVTREEQNSSLIHSMGVTHDGSVLGHNGQILPNDRPPLDETQLRDTILREIEKDQRLNPHPDTVPNPTSYMDKLQKEMIHQEEGKKDSFKIPVIHGNYSEGKI